MSNTHFPARPGYTGPTVGHFALLHHTQLFEYSHNVNERIAYVRAAKPENEIPTRCQNMLWIDPAEVDLSACEQACEQALQALQAYEQACERALQALQAWQALQACEQARQTAAGAVLAYIAKHNPSHAWNGYTLIFPPQG